MKCGSSSSSLTKAQTRKGVTKSNGAPRWRSPRKEKLCTGLHTFFEAQSFVSKFKVRLTVRNSQLASGNCNVHDIAEPCSRSLAPRTSRRHAQDGTLGEGRRKTERRRQQEVEVGELLQSLVTLQHVASAAHDPRGN